MKPPYRWDPAQSFELTEPVEVRITVGRFASRTELVLSAWVTQSGTVAYSLESGSGGPPQSLGNLQSPLIFPRKAVEGWQREVVEFAHQGLGTVYSVR